MRPSRAIWLVLGVVASILIAWFLVEVVLHIVLFLVKAVLVLAVAAVVFVVLWLLLRRSSSRS
jgi:hypothetical protein